MADKSGTPTPNYLYEMLVSRGSVYAAMTAGLAAALASVPLGVKGALIPLTIFAAAEAIAALFVPDMPSFRAAVDRYYRRERRERLRAHLIEELKPRIAKDAPEIERYRRMCNRLHSLKRLVADRRSTMTATDLEHLEDAVVDYLGLLLARLLLEERLAHLDEAVLVRRREQIRQRLPQTGGLEQRRLSKALEEVERLLENRRRLESRRLTLESTLWALPETLEDIYQNLIVNPAEAADYLSTALARLRIEEELDQVVEREIERVGIAPIERRAVAAQEEISS